eukprot:TRINITY_DN3964_c0_g1_i1.p1 TRINITY_DN3964_c0_g1~~TRINITY_DN3964_c0_g1_i1.p1  ORF type:complete len:724 (-),score=94.91 TRINITY_DN3964_c0_g1_i1:984-3155(-)
MSKDEGVQFPKDSSGQRSTTEVNREAFAAAAEPVNTELANNTRREQKWRGRYQRYVIQHVEAALRSRKDALDMARAGLTYLHKTINFVRDGKEMPLCEAMASMTEGTFETGVIEGTQPMPANPTYEVTYQGKQLSGDALRVQLDNWARQGVIEASAATAMTKAIDTPAWLDLRGKCFVLLGASSAMGPVHSLLKQGATVIGVDINREGVWKMLINAARNSPGRLIFPMSKPQKECTTDDALFKAAGCDLLTQVPEVRNWLLTVEPGKPLIIGSYCYLPGVLFMRIAMAMDAICEDILAKRDNSGLSFLCTPTDAHVVTSAAKENAALNFRRAPFWQQLMMGKLGGLKRNTCPTVKTANGDELSIVDAIVPEQGPNYILAKRLQHWRAILAQSEGHVVSSNIAPSTSTVSVTQNKSFAWAYAGMHNFKPIEVYKQETSCTMMTLLLIHDVCNPVSSAQPQTSESFRNPLCLFGETACHGGAWRTGFKFGSLGLSSVLAGFTGTVATPWYLKIYNSFQTVGWGYVLAKAIAAAVQGSNVWEAVATPLNFFQKLAALEAVHSLLGMVRAPFATTAMQVLSRVMLTNLIPRSDDAQAQWGSKAVVFAWAITEVFRYLFFAASGGNAAALPKSQQWMTWMRYTLFIVLYPLGVSGELKCMYDSLPQLAQARESADPSLVGHLAQVVYDKGTFWKLAVPVWTLGLYTLYTRMLSQRARVLGKKKGGRKN